MLYYRDASNVTRCAACGDEIDLQDHFGPEACLTECPSCWQRSIDPNAPAPEHDIIRNGDTVRVQISPGYAHTYRVFGWISDETGEPMIDVDPIEGATIMNADFAPLTKAEALTVQYLHKPSECVYAVGPRGGVTRKAKEWRRNGQTKTWKRSPERFSLPVKHGLYDHDTVTERDAHLVCPAERCPVCNPS